MVASLKYGKFKRMLELKYKQLSNVDDKGEI